MAGFIAEKYFRLTKSIDKLVRRLLMAYSRMEAHKYRKEFVRKAGKSVVNRQVKKSIKAYSRKRFGTKAYWPYLAYYTEIRGEFVDGWIPYEYYKYVLEPKLNPPAYHNLGSLRTLDYRRFGEFAVKPVFQTISGTFYNADFEILNESQLKNILTEHNDTIVVKEEFGFGGKQVRVLHSSEFKPEDLQNDINYIIQPFIKQHKTLSDLYPESVNTFRVTTFLKKDGSVDITFVILRFGADGAKVDNLSSGGQYIFIDDTGKPSRIAYDDNCHAAGETHKNTGYRYSDLELPMLSELIEKCRTAHQRYPYNRFIGWDICVNEQGDPKMLEWNTQEPTFPLVDAMFGPFFPDDDEF